MTTINTLTDAGIRLALALWTEQADRYNLGPDRPSAERLDEWVGNRTYPYATLNLAATGDIEALAMVRSEAGLPILS